MTIAAGVLQEESVVLAADTLHITGGIPIYKTKLFDLDHRDSITVSIAGAGDSDFIKTIAQKIDSSLPGAASLDDLARVVEDENLKFHRKHVFKHPGKAEDKPEYDLLIAACEPKEKKMRLLKTTRGTTLQVHSYEFIGIGSPVANAFATGIFSPMISHIEAECFAMYGIHQAKKFDQNCGGDTEVIGIQIDGRRVRFRQHYIKKVEEYFDAFTADFKDFMLPAELDEFESEHVLGDMLKETVRKWTRMRAELRKLHDDHYLY